MPTDQWLASMRATSTPGASRRASGRVVAPERRISSPVMTKIAAGVWKARTGSLDGVVTSMAESSSMLRFLKEGTEATVCG
jgi:hypothetical protein